jgi:two-component system, NarL family, nitrate/nitrite response regulator NarL
MRTKHILVADDNRQIRHAVCRMVCADERFEPCSEVENGLEAVEFAKREHPDLIVMDLSMPVMDGLEAAKRIREVIPHIAIVLVSMHADLLSASDMLNFGISALVSKERAAKDLIPALCSLLNMATSGNA